MDDALLEKRAIEEIMKDTKKAAIRADSIGAHGWAKPRRPVTNKRFLRNMLTSTLIQPSRSVTKRKTNSGTISDAGDSKTVSGNRKHSYDQRTRESFKMSKAESKKQTSSVKEDDSFDKKCENVKDSFKSSESVRDRGRTGRHGEKKLALYKDKKTI